MHTTPWQWYLALPKHVESMVDLANAIYSQEIDQILIKNPTRYSYHLHRAVLNQTFNPSQLLLTVAEDINHKVIAYSWLERGKFTPYSDQEMAVAEILHVDLGLPVRQRMALCAQSMQQWITWCEVNQIPVLTSSSIRADQIGFMRLHQRFGFQVRGSIAYKRIGDNNDTSSK